MCYAFVFGTHTLTTYCQLGSKLMPVMGKPVSSVVFYPIGRVLRMKFLQIFWFYFSLNRVVRAATFHHLTSLSSPTFQPTHKNAGNQTVTSQNMSELLSRLLYHFLELSFLSHNPEEKLVDLVFLPTNFHHVSLCWLHISDASNVISFLLR